MALPLFYSTLLRELHAANQKLADEMRKVAFAATHDALTGVANRSLFGDRLEHALAHARRERHMMAVLYLDLDGFKEVNDSLGHRVGDDLLTEVARRLGQCVRDSDTVARMGGDEFTVLLEGIRRTDEAASIAEKIIARLAQPFHIDEHSLEVTASIGISVYPNDYKDGESLVQAADAAMYRAKAHGGKRYTFHSTGTSA